MNEPGDEPEDDELGGACGAEGETAANEPPVWNILVNSPGAEAPAGGGAGVADGGAENVGPGAGGAAAGSLSAPNICVKLPGDDGGAAGGAACAGSGGV